jgi:AsmA protein
MLKRRRTEQDKLLGDSSFALSSAGARARRRRRGRFRAARYCVVTAAILATPYLSLSLLVRAGKIQPVLEAKLSQELGRQVTIGGLGVGPGFGTLTASDVSIADDPLFSSAPFMHAQKIALSVDRWPLIFQGRVEVSAVAIEEPTITLIHNRSEWNYYGVLAAGPAPSATSPGLSLSIRRGILVVRGESDEPLVFREVSLDAPRFSTAMDSQFLFTAAVSGGGTLKVNGRAGPVRWQGRSALIPASVLINAKRVSIGDVNLAAAISSSVGGLLSLDAAGEFDGTGLEMKGTVQFDKLRLSAQGSPAPEALVFGFTLDYDAARRGGRLSRCEAALKKGAATITGTYAFEEKNTKVNLAVSAQGVAISPLSGMLAAAGVPLPPGTSLQGGVAFLNLAVEGDLSGPNVTGAVAVHNTKLTSFDLEDRLSEISGLDMLHISRDLLIDEWSANVRVGPEGIAVRDLVVQLPEVGTLTGNGAIEPDRTLQFSMVAVRSRVAEKRPIPFTVRGACISPIFRQTGKGS